MLCAPDRDHVRVHNIRECWLYALKSRDRKKQIEKSEERKHHGDRQGRYSNGFYYHRLLKHAKNQLLKHNREEWNKMRFCSVFHLFFYWFEIVYQFVNHKLPHAVRTCRVSCESKMPHTFIRRTLQLTPKYAILADIKFQAPNSRGET